MRECSYQESRWRDRALRRRELSRWHCSQCCRPPGVRSAYWSRSPRRESWQERGWPTSRPVRRRDLPGAEPALSHLIILLALSATRVLKMCAFRMLLATSSRLNQSIAFGISSGPNPAGRFIGVAGLHSARHVGDARAGPRERLRIDRDDRQFECGWKIVCLRRGGRSVFKC